MTTTITIPARAVEDHDDCLTAAIEIVCREHNITPDACTARWDDERQRDAVLVTIHLRCDDV